MNDSKLQIDVSDDRPASRAGALWVTLTMLALSVIMLGMLMMAARDAARLQQSEAAIQQECEEVQLAINENKAAFQRIEDARHDILQVMRKTRSAADIPVIDAPLLAATATGNQELVIHVPDLPETSIEVIVDASWELRQTTAGKEEAPEDQDSPAETGKIPAGEQQWVVKLTPGRRYLLKSAWEPYQETTLGWTMKSSDPDDKPVSHEIPIPNVRYNSWSVSDEDYLSYPVAIDRLTLARSQPVDTVPPDLTTQLVVWTHTGKRKADDQAYRVRMTVSLRRAGPPKMYAGHAKSFSKPGIELRYDKDGLFDLIEK